MIGKLSPAAGPAVQDPSSTNLQILLFPKRSNLFSLKPLWRTWLRLPPGAMPKPAVTLAICPGSRSTRLAALGGVQTAERAYLGETLARKPLEPACRNTAVIDRSRAFCKNPANVIRRQYLSIAILLIDMRPAILSASTLAQVRYCTITLKLKNLVAVVKISGTQGSEYSTGISGGSKQGRPRWHTMGDR